MSAARPVRPARARATVLVENQNVVCIIVITYKNKEVSDRIESLKLTYMVAFACPD